MKHTLLLILISFASFSLDAQTNFIWTGSAGNNDWNDGGNWNQGGATPGSGDYVQFNSNATVMNTGATPTVLRLIVGLTVTVTLDMDLNISNTTEAYGIQISAVNGVLNLGDGATNRTFNISVSTTASGIRMYSAGAQVILGDGSELNITQSTRGIFFQIASSTFTNNGTINITNYSSRGIYLNGFGTFENNGTLTIENPGGSSNEGIRAISSTFNNNSGGTITVNKANTDGIRIFSGSTLTNAGTLNVTVKDAPSSGQHGLEVTGTFNNSGTFNGDGGISTSGRPLVTGGLVTNQGTINLTGGQALVRLNNSGTFTNSMCAVINLGTGGRAFQSGGSFTNNGFIETTFNVCIQANGGTATNNAFYTSGSTWGVAAGGTVTDNGSKVPISLNAGGSCIVDLSAGSSNMMAYSWIYSGMTFADNASNGTLDLTNAGFPNQTGPFTITTSNAGCGAYSSEFTVEVQNVCSQALPVEFISFEGRKAPYAIMLNWATALEINNDYFSVERSADGRTFESIGIIKGAGNSLVTNEYEFTDAEPFIGINYYRLKQMDFDGRYEYSDVINIEYVRENDNSTQPVLYPNPAKQELTIIDGEGIATVYNQLGQPVLSFTIQNAIFTQDISRLLNGQYVLKIEKENRRTILKKFTVRK
jgi:fibronectin-binding autotransporter adhesin